MGFFVLGVNHKECPVAIREKLFFTSSMVESALTELVALEEISEALILSTCNRVEFYGSAEKVHAAEELVLGFIGASRGVSKEEFSHFLYRHEGTEAVRHLFRVASGLDSLVIGENEILGQVRQAFRTANHAGSVHAY